VRDDKITSDQPSNISNEYNAIDENQLNRGQMVFDCCKTYFQVLLTLGVKINGND
jgi:hypothetical protein